MKGIIVINPYHIPIENVEQAERLKKEFNALGVEVKVVDNGFLASYIKDNKVECEIGNLDFIVYLDKDKYLSYQLEQMGYRLFNCHNSIRICDDKGETFLALAGSGINMPDTIFGALCYRKDCEILSDTADKIINRLSLPLIVKESFGSLGTGVFKADTKEQLLEIMEKVRLKPHLYQKYLPYKKGVDVRVIVVGGKVVASMKRINENDFRSNIALGGRGEKIALSENFKSTAEKVAKTLNLDYCGVDLLYGENDQPYVCEVNSNAFFKGIESVTGVNVAKIYAQYIISQIAK